MDLRLEKEIKFLCTVKAVFDISVSFSGKFTAKKTGSFDTHLMD